MIGTRSLNLKLDDALFVIVIRIFAPEGSGDIWSCQYEIEWPEGLQRMSASGGDGIQALSNAMCMIGADIYTSSYHEKGQIQYWKDWKGYGFPVPTVIRDMLVGDDAKYF